DILNRAARTAKATTSARATLTIAVDNARFAGPIVVDVAAERVGTTGKSRLDVRQAPIPELAGLIAVSDGQSAQVYDRANNRVVTGNRADLSRILTDTARLPMKALTWDETIDRLLAETQGRLLGSERVDGVDTWKLELTPRPGSEAARRASNPRPTTVWIEQSRAIVVRAALSSDQGAVTVSARNVELNPRLPSSTWTLNAPANARTVSVFELRPQTITLDLARGLQSPKVLFPEPVPAGATLRDIQLFDGSVIQRYTRRSGEFVITAGRAPQTPAPVGRDATRVTIRGQQAVVVSRDGQTAVTWVENGFAYSVAGALTPDEATQIAASLR
ncbi:MAG: DUF2092 domain-containing protein, partial [Dehalococcoidia bacterium]|nr:DUF2092 domain-containing protein [Dehalococcoidia bacterium]